MSQFKALAPNVMANGAAVLAVVDGMWFKETALRILRNHGIDNPQPGTFYPEQCALDAFKEISDTYGPTTLMEIGKKVSTNAKLPPEIDTLDKALPRIDDVYHILHPGGEIGHYQFIKVSDRSGKMVCNTPYPCDFERGIIHAMAMRFMKGGSFPKVVHDDSQPCRKNGAESCTYLVTW